MCRECGGSRIRVADHSIEVHDDGLVMPARCESLIAIRSRDSRGVMRRHRDVQLRGMGSYVRSGCSPPTPGEGGAIAATRFPHRFVLLDSCVPPPRPRHKERVNAHHELAIFSCLFPVTPSCTPAPSSLSFVLLPSGYSCLVGSLLSFLARTNIRPRPEYSAWCLVCPLLFGRGFEAGVAHS